MAASGSLRRPRLSEGRLCLTFSPSGIQPYQLTSLGGAVGLRTASPARSTAGFLSAKGDFGLSAEDER